MDLFMVFAGYFWPFVPFFGGLAVLWWLARDRGGVILDSSDSPYT